MLVGVGDRARAWPLVEQSLPQFRQAGDEAGDQTSAAYYLEVQAMVASRTGRPQRAVRLLGAAAAVC